MSRLFRAGRSLVLVLLAGLSACSGGGGSSSGSGASGGGTPPTDSGGPPVQALSFAVTGLPGVTADSTTLVGSERVGRTTFDYTYTVKATNGNPTAVDNVTMTVTSASAATVVTDGTLTFGNLAAGASATSTDTFTIRQDRQVPFSDTGLTFTIAGTLQLTSSELIRAAKAQGDIDDETALVYEVFALFGDPRLPTQYKGDDSSVFDSQIMGEVAGRIATLSPANRTILEPFLVPPIYAGSWYAQRQGVSIQAAPAAQRRTASRVRPADEPCPACPSVLWSSVSQAGGHVRVWWETSIPEREAVANSILTAVEGKIWPELTTLMGREPLSDALRDRNGGDGLLDIYLGHFDSPGIIALTFAYPFACKATPTYIVVDPDGRYPWAIRSVVAHEFLHTIQFTYNVARDCDEYSWLSEATATWAMDFVYPNDNYEQFRALDYLSHPGYELGNAGYSSYDYGAYLLPFYLARKYTPSVVKTIWENTEQYDSRDAVDQAIPGGFKERWPEFTLYNWNRGSVHHYQDWDGLVYAPVYSSLLQSDDRDFLKSAPWRAVKDFYDKAVPAKLDGAPDRELPFDLLKTEGQANLSANYYHYVFDDDTVHTASFYNGFTFELAKRSDLSIPAGTRFAPQAWTAPARDKARVKALVKVGGVWKEPEDWTEIPAKTFCRDQADKRIEELVLIFSNAEHQVQSPGIGRIFPPDNPPTLRLTNMFCGTWKGTSDYTTTGFGGVMRLHSNLTWTPVDYGDSDAFIYAATGTFTWSVTSGPDDQCVFAGSGSGDIQSSSPYNHDLLLDPGLLDGVNYRGYLGSGYSYTPMHYTVTCPEDPHGPYAEVKDAGDWFPALSGFEHHFKVSPDGKVIDGQLTDDLSGDHWSWHFEAQPE